MVWLLQHSQQAAEPLEQKNLAGKAKDQRQVELSETLRDKLFTQYPLP